MKVAIIGATGFVGKALCKEFSEQGHDVVAVSRNNYDACTGHYELVINASNNSKKFLSEREPLVDFDRSVVNQLQIILDYPADTHLLVSSVDVYEDLTSPEYTAESLTLDRAPSSSYGLHKWFAEQLVRHYCPNWLIVRLAGMVGPGLVKNPVFDILHDLPLRIHPDSEFQFMNTSDVAHVVQKLVMDEHCGEIFNVCATGLVSPRQIAELAGKEMNLSELEPGATPRIVNISNAKLSQFFGIPCSFDTIRAYVGNHS